jgi:protocatechuate 3,4-dioxygenase beta subunit
MNRNRPLTADRRRFLRTSGALGLALPSWRGLAAAAQAEDLPATPSCADGDEPTPRQMEGPFFKPRSPQRTSLTAGLQGSRILVSGLVLSTRCRPVVGDFWISGSATPR